MLGFIRRQRRVLGERLARRGLAHTFSLPGFLLHERLGALIDGHAAGRALDVGSGLSPYKRRLLERCDSVVSVDVEDRSGQVDVIADVMSMPEIEDASFDTVLCTQVLEHVPRPPEAVAELARVLKPGGKLILSAPHLSALHEVPGDFYRYTRFGLESLLARSGLQVERVQEAGGLVSFLAHGLSMALLCPLAPVPGLGAAAWLFNYLLGVRLMRHADRLLGLSGVYPCNYVVLAAKPGGAAPGRPSAGPSNCD